MAVKRSPIVVVSLIVKESLTDPPDVFVPPNAIVSCCWVMGMDNVFEHLKGRLGIEVGETTADGAFTLLPICCLGACHEAPAMMIADRLYGNLTPKRIDEILEKERNA